jgi:hypothetical protein
MFFIKKESCKALFHNLIIILFSVSMNAAEGIPNEIIDSIDPPPTSSIDNYLVITVFISIILAGYHFHKYHLKYPKNGNNLE